MQQIYLYILISGLTIASPGPGVVLTLTNTLNYNLRHAMAGITGVVVGMGMISVIAASSVGVIIGTSHQALFALNAVGAVYLACLGIKLFRSAPRGLNNSLLPLPPKSVIVPPACSCFRQGLLITLLNPKPIAFFMALFPHFIDPGEPFVPQFSILSAIFCVLVLLIHSLYGLFASSVKKKMSSGKIFVVLNKSGGVIFMLFATGLLVSALYSH
ncbi:LysE family translocator [Enterobacter hormaechei]|uniref:LysE family translocator n=1 Tax=Enterobacter hormaechei TaxID=158836 RepID=UPI002A7610AD|nr:LysE family translocator [Enterobacter hormaechei]MDY3571640.1 LysE family translocator [Enterobacter hormaechei]